MPESHLVPFAPNRSVTSGFLTSCWLTVACIRFLNIVCTLTRNILWRRTLLTALVSAEQAYASGMRSAFKRCARVRESILSFFIPVSYTHLRAHETRHD